VYKIIEKVQRKIFKNNLILIVYLIELGLLNIKRLKDKN
tara:strand:- start:2010 stop:2126 length:117 start_codon:yes stop_codon:yes gene_type:complete